MASFSNIRFMYTGCLFVADNEIREMGAKYLSMCTWINLNDLNLSMLI